MSLNTVEPVAPSLDDIADGHSINAAAEAHGGRMQTPNPTKAGGGSFGS